MAEIAALASRHGVGLVELRAVGNQIDIPAYAEEQRWLEKSPVNLLGSEGVRIAGLNSSAKLSQPFEEAAQEINSFAPLMEHFGVTGLRVFDGSMDPAKEQDKVWQWLDAWEALREKQGWSFNLSIETHSSLLHTDDIARLFSRGHEHVDLLWDSHHTWKHSGLDPVTLWPEVKPWTTHIHFKDSISKPSERHDYTYVLPGEGEFPLLPLLDCLKEDGFTGPVSLEWERLWHSYMPPLEDALTALAGHLSPS